MPYAPLIDAEAIQEAGEYMRHYTRPFITPIARSTADDDSLGESLGSGTFLRLRGKPYLLTNEHVACFMGHSRLSFFQAGGQHAAAIVNPFQALAYPVDAALSRLEDDIFAAAGKQSVSTDSIDTMFGPAEGEVFFIHGFPGVQARWSALFGGIMARTFPYATDLIPLPAGYDPERHFALSFPDDICKSDGQPMIRPNPRGLSGSVVWDTKYVAAGTNLWAPTDARVCGLLFAYDEAHKCFIATRIEAVRTFLLHALRHEAAYFRWLNDRQGSLWEPLPDWVWAEGTIRILE
ncbi:MAG: hypothetical protein K2Y37_20540 [Pirellulales bacterium]|nr:hypothetical protein [Pirellulales bacterium]